MKKQLKYNYPLYLLFLFLWIPLNGYSQIKIDELKLPEDLGKSRIYGYVYFGNHLIINHGDSISFYDIHNYEIKISHIETKKIINEIFFAHNMKYSPKINFYVFDSDLYLIDSYDTIKIIKFDVSFNHVYFNMELNGFIFRNLYSSMDYLLFSLERTLYNIDTISHEFPIIVDFQRIKSRNYLYSFHPEIRKLKQVEIDSNYFQHSLFIQDSNIFYIAYSDEIRKLLVGDFINDSLKFEIELERNLRSMYYIFFSLNQATYLLTSSGYLGIIEIDNLKIDEIQNFDAVFLQTIKQLKEEIYLFDLYSISIIDLDQKKLKLIKIMEGEIIQNVQKVYDSGLLILTVNKTTNDYGFYLMSE